MKTTGPESQVDEAASESQEQHCAAAHAALPPALPPQPCTGVTADGTPSKFIQEVDPAKKQLGRGWKADLFPIRIAVRSRNADTSWGEGKRTVTAYTSTQASAGPYP